jgi:hypothetical protein
MHLSSSHRENPNSAEANQTGVGPEAVLCSSLHCLLKRFTPYLPKEVALAGEQSPAHSCGYNPG